MNLYQFYKKDPASDQGHVNVMVMAHSGLRAVIAINNHLHKLGRDDLELASDKEIVKIVPGDYGVIQSNVQRQ